MPRGIWHEERYGYANMNAEAIYDAGLVRKFNGGDESAFGELMNRHKTRIFAAAMALLRNHADAEEITQDTFIRAHRGFSRFRGDSSVATWLHRIAVNLARNRYWYFFRRRRHSTLSLDAALNQEGDMTFSDLLSAADPDPAQESSRNEFVDAVESCMEKLEPSHREILAMRSVWSNVGRGAMAVAFGSTSNTARPSPALASTRRTSAFWPWMT